jgi:hypothetical protein
VQAFKSNGFSPSPSTVAVNRWAKLNVVKLLTFARCQTIFQLNIGALQLVEKGSRQTEQKNGSLPVALA